LKRNFRSVEILVKKLISTFGSGSHISCLKDAIIDIDVVREYQPGDKKLDSKSSLRTSRTMSRTFVPEKSLTVMLLLDVSASNASKFEEAVAVALYLCYLAELSNDAVGLMTFGERTHIVQPSNDVRNVSAALEEIYLDQNLDQVSNLEIALSKLGGMAPSNMITVIISDFLYSFTDRIASACRQIAGGTNNIVIAPVMTNSMEWNFQDLPFQVDFEDAESDLCTNWNLRSDKLRNNQLQSYHKWQTDLKLFLRQARVEPVFVDVNRPNFMMPLVKHFLRA
jgi:hypothetical protein